MKNDNNRVYCLINLNLEIKNVKIELNFNKLLFLGLIAAATVIWLFL